MIRVALRNAGSASAEDIAKLVSQLGGDIDPDYKFFVGQYDGASLKSNAYRIDDLEEMAGIRQFIPVNEILECRKIFENYEFGISRTSFPIAENAGGHFTLMDVRHTGCVFFWNRDFDKISTVCDSFLGFLDSINPIELPDKMDRRSAKVWISPDFKPKFPL